MHKLTVSIVNYNAGNFLVDCLHSLERVKDEAIMEVFVVDNASSDGSLQKAKKNFPKLHFIENKKNLGFGAANNQVLKKLNSEYVLLLNPDSQILPGTIKYMLKFLEENPKVGACSCRVEKKDGKLDWASHRGFPTPWASFLYYFLKDDRLYHQTFKDIRKAHEIDSIAGAFFLTRNSVLNKVGLFDESFFLYAEDLDLCFRIKQAGYKIMYVPGVKIIHLKGLSSGIKSHSRELSSADLGVRKKAFNSFYQTMIVFYKKNLSDKYPFFINWLVYLGINLKWWLAKRRMVV